MSAPMETTGGGILPATRVPLATEGISTGGAEHWNCSAAELVEQAVTRGEGVLVEGGAFNAVTAPHTGRLPKDRFIVPGSAGHDEVDWGQVNCEFQPDAYDLLREDLLSGIGTRDLFVRDMWAGADSEYRIAVRVVTTSAWHSLFANNMFRMPDPAELPGMRPELTVIHDPTFTANPSRHRTRSGAFIILNLERREVLIGGTFYAGEIKKSVFSFLNYRLPAHGVLPMHCSVNVGSAGDVAVFFGLSGTGKTTLSADPARGLIGDDEHGWSDSGVFNFEGGCYAKVIRLSRLKEPEIFATTRRFGTILENVVVRPDRTVDLDSDEITENTRASYPLSFIPNFVPDGRAGHPGNVFFLTADAYGVLPPISRLTPAQAAYHFLSGYTARLAGTEAGVTEPVAAFSACFGAPFMPRHPIDYATMLQRKLEQHRPNVWLVNTGWIGGAYGEGRRIDLTHTRAILEAALTGALDQVQMVTEPAFGLSIPTAVPGLPSEILRPRDSWSDGSRYDTQAAKLAGMFAENFARFAAMVSDDVRGAGPLV